MAKKHIGKHNSCKPWCGFKNTRSGKIVVRAIHTDDFVKPEPEVEEADLCRTCAERAMNAARENAETLHCEVDEQERIERYLKGILAKETAPGVIGTAR